MSREAKKLKKGTGILDEQESSQSSSHVRIEPFVEFEEDLSAPPRAEVESDLNEQIDSLKPQVENIAQTADLQNLSSDQVDILKRYISLKETEVRDLKEIVSQYQKFLKRMNRQTKHQGDKNQQLIVDYENIRVREEALRIENRDLKERYQNDLSRMRQDFDDKLNRAGHYEIEMESIKKSREEWREKIKEDLKRIKLKERELENKYELLKRDTQALLDSKDKHVLELKRKNDALELELETFEERLQKLNTILSSVDGKKTRLIETMKLALALLEEIDKTNDNQD